MNKEVKQTECAFSWLCFCIYLSRSGSLKILINLQFSFHFAMTSPPRIRWTLKMAAKS